MVRWPLMGRTAPTLRAALRAEVARLERVIKYVRDPELRKALEEALKHAEVLQDAYLAAGPPLDPLEVVLLSMIAELYRRCLRVE